MHKLLFKNILKWSEVAQLCPTLWNPMDCSLPGFSRPWDFPGIFQGRVLEWVAQGIFPTQGLNPFSRIVGRCFTLWATREALNILCIYLFWLCWVFTVVHITLSSHREQGYPLVTMRGLLIVVASLLQSTDSPLLGFSSCDARA